MSSIIKNRMKQRIAPLLLAVASVATIAQDSAYAQQDYGGDDYGESYQDYAEQDDGLYANYAAKQQDKAAGGGGGPGLGKAFMACGLGWIAGAKIHSGRATKKMTEKHKKEQKELYTQYYNDVYKIQESNAELEAYIATLGDNIKGVTEEQEMERLQRDYDEFKQPDIDGDDRISRAEFNMYVRDYLSNYPGMEPKDYPKFDDFDHDGDGYIGFQEYAQQMALAVQQAEKQQAAASF
eukprot:CAMPEP_0178516810 /NCGR_PEP_ID=MMETSP0696-20121128/25332_1 /TAXON_ID=265572 /ORGANISM="Extubocellulus spinifer, Strain CCMP396" /LENGTH=236 /DNA_ID=CAMNT_0020147151 /DNA_START=38 /DNA_END=748 /DNA_ORIENTATION=+